MSITTLLTFARPVYEAIKAHDFERARIEREKALSFIDSGIGYSWLEKFKERRNYLFTCKLDDSIDIDKVESGFNKIYQKYRVYEDLERKLEHAQTRPLKKVNWDEVRNSSSKTDLDYNNSDNQAYLYSIHAIDC